MRLSVETLHEAIHSDHSTFHHLKVVLTNTEPSSATHLKHIKQIKSSNGHPKDGKSIESICTVKPFYFNIGDLTFKAGKSNFEPFRYIVFYNKATKRILGYFDYGSKVTLLRGETFTVGKTDHTKSLCTFDIGLM